MKAPLLTAALTGFAAFLIGVAFSHAAPSGDRAASLATSLAAFDQMAKVLTSPRCINCHTVTSFPRQGDDRHEDLYGVTRGVDGEGAPGLRCSTCHGRANNPDSGVPGVADTWRLAPLSMGWEGRSLAEICRQLKNPALNGGRNGAAIIGHLRTPFVMWGWSPGIDPHGRARTTPPISYEAFLRAANTWVSTGEACPAQTPGHAAGRPPGRSM